MLFQKLVVFVFKIMNYFKITGKNKYIFEMHDLRLKVPSTFILAGSSGCGKTEMTLNIVRNADVMFEDSRCAQNVVYYYKQWQDSYDRVQKEGIIHHWVNELPTCNDLTERTETFKQTGGSIVVIDDFAGELNKDIAHIFTALSHHLTLVVFLLTQNLFSKNPVFRDISLNSKYIILFKNPRDSSQINNFARQFSPGKVKFIVESFRKATEFAFSYCLYDSCQTTPDMLRVRSHILPHEAPMKIWLPTKKI